jgi:hypothetical protein
MIKRHTFKALIDTVVAIEKGISELEDTLCVCFDKNWMTDAPFNIIRAIAEGFFDKIAINSVEDAQADTIEELLYHFIYMEDCGNDSEHCREKLVRVSNDIGEEKAISCTNIDELYSVICTYLERQDINFHFNFCHSHKLDDDGSKDEG